MSARAKRILLAEDNENDIELMLAALSEQRLDAEVTVVRDGVEACDYLSCRGAYADRPPGNPSVVLLDIKMPRMNGLQVLREMRSEEPLRSIPVVMLTSSREERDLAASYALGVNAYVVKPVGFVEFMDVVRSLGVFWVVINESPPAAGQAA